MNPQDLRAVVIGIGEYEKGIGNLSGPALQVPRVVGWLLGQGVPVANIDIFGDKVVQSSCPDDLRKHAASQDSIGKFFTRELREIRSDALFVYWGGHGVTKFGSDRHLVCSDACLSDIRSIDIRAMLHFCRFTLKMSKQLWVIDACGEHAELKNLDAYVTPFSVPRGGSISGTIQNVVFSSRLGSYADDIEAFTDCFLEQVSDNSIDFAYKNLSTIVATAKTSQKYKRSNPAIHCYDQMHGEEHLHAAAEITEAPTLTFTIEPSSSGRRKRNVHACAWMPQPDQLACDSNIPIAGIGKWIAKEVSKFCCTNPFFENIFVEIFCHEEDMNIPFDQIALGREYDELPLGFNHRVVLRSLPRARGQAGWKPTEWGKSWRAAHGANSLQTSWIAANTPAPEIHLHIAQHHSGHCLAIDPNNVGEAVTQALTIAIKAGVAQAVWLRSGPPLTKEHIESWLSCTTHAQLPEHLRNSRRQACGDPNCDNIIIGRGIALLWDDPTRNPHNGRPLAALSSEA